MEWWLSYFYKGTAFFHWGFVSPEGLPLKKKKKKDPKTKPINETILIQFKVCFKVLCGVCGRFEWEQSSYFKSLCFHFLPLTLKYISKQQ